MSGTFKFHNTTNETIPFQAEYMFPTQQTKVHKHLIKLPPKNSADFKQSDIIRIEFPSDNYMNVLNSVLQFDVQTENNSPDQFIVSGTNESTTVSGGTKIELLVAQEANAMTGRVLIYMDQDSNFWQCATILYNDETSLFLDQNIGTKLGNNVRV